ncbi:hypothetical protein D9M68_958750 [compost metagenome]
MGGYREILNDSHAIFVEPDNPAALGSAFLRLLKNPADFPDREVGFEFVRNERLWSANAKKYFSIYEKILENAK